MRSDSFSLECCSLPSVKTPTDSLFWSMHSEPRLMPGTQQVKSLQCMTYLSVEDVDNQHVKQHVTYFQVVRRETKENKKE